MIYESLGDKRQVAETEVILVQLLWPSGEFGTLAVHGSGQSSFLKLCSSTPSTKNITHCQGKSREDQKCLKVFESV